ncbi:unnamed protein product, partial [Meganyctiphanes norvegica]
MSSFQRQQAILGFIKKNSQEGEILKDALSKIEKREKSFRNLALQHQTNIAKESNISRIWELSSTNTALDEKYINDMQSEMSQCEVVLAHQGESAKMGILAVEDAEDRYENEDAENFNVKKHWTMEGKVDQIRYVISFISSSSVTSNTPVECPYIVQDIALSAADKELEVLKLALVNENDIEMFTLGLHIYQ